MQSKSIMVLLITLMQVSMMLGQDWEVDFEKAKDTAFKEDKTIIMVFQGSDWCAPCIKLDRQIWSTEAFKTYAAENYVMLQVDFPRRKKNTLSESQTTANEKLAETYNKSGVFPYVVLLDYKGNLLGHTGYKKATPEAYITELNSFIKPRSSNTPSTPTKGHVYKRATKMMGSRFEITVVAEDSTTANVHIDSAIGEIRRIERLISSWDKNSRTSEINRNAGHQPVKVEEELFNLIERSIRISELTDGAFDLSYASMDRIWKYDGSMKQMPTREEVSRSVTKVGYENIILDKLTNTVFFKNPEMKIGFGAIGKGYAADKAKQLLKENGVVSGIINASGDMNTWGKQPNGTDWKVAITNPLNKNKAFALLTKDDAAVVTSGNYERYVEFDGKRYSHIIDPRTGYPSSGIISVTIFAPMAELADALATSVFVMGIEVGMDRINQMPNIECIIIDERGNIKKSNNIRIDSL